MYDVIVIGGGASGMMAAISSARLGAKTLLLEKNNILGKKLAITGGGRCNIYNAEEDLKTLLVNYGKAEKYLYSSFSRFGIDDSNSFFGKIGVATYVEPKKRAFPVSQRATEVVKATTIELENLGVEVLLNQSVITILSKNNKISEIITKTGKYKASNYIIATGGMSRPETGSTGDGFGWLSDLGHRIRKPTPGITPLVLKERWISKASGIVIKNASIKFLQNNQVVLKTQGNVLITHFGLSGPAILNSSSEVSQLLSQGEVYITIDCMPETDVNTLDKDMAFKLHKYGAKKTRNILNHLAPEGLVQLIKVYLKNKLDLDKNAADFNKSERQMLVSSIKQLSFQIDRLMGDDKSVITDGGLILDEVDTKTFHSKIINNLFVTGDILDISRPSGGYSLQLCWTSGYIAGQNAAAKK